jgi:hypothetical protein
MGVPIGTGSSPVAIRAVADQIVVSVGPHATAATAGRKIGRELARQFFAAAWHLQPPVAVPAGSTSSFQVAGVAAAP